MRVFQSRTEPSGQPNAHQSCSLSDSHNEHSYMYTTTRSRTRRWRLEWSESSRVEPSRVIDDSAGDRGRRGARPQSWPPRRALVHTVRACEARAVASVCPTRTAARCSPLAARPTCTSTCASVGIGASLMRERGAGAKREAVRACRVSAAARFCWRIATRPLLPTSLRASVSVPTTQLNCPD